MTESETELKHIDDLYHDTARLLLPVFEHPDCSLRVRARIEALVIELYGEIHAGRGPSRSLWQRIKNWLF
jgi:hypothetical protein